MAALPLLSTSAEALVMALAEVGVATAAVAPVAPVAAAITFPVAALAVGAGAVAVRMGLFNTSDTPPRMPKIPKKTLKRLLKVYGKKIHKKLKKRTRYDTNNRIVWNNTDFRIDLRRSNKVHVHIKTWHLHFNKTAILGIS
ncbi:hypothetical protein CSPX01_09267 [Colletotrichum filicis]|nr:hypothetical protein CSPX01_09267 [Colletotrichum filicis]